ncbi:hypothetical protein BHE74_00035813 [Ensete ventricosum]|nr:hypothetical protein BHE74_00035813 [Ensete ventricosum]RZS11467.1 hypothetical protein BHM03_00042800 [Ensete ventricosum]
MDAFVWSTLAFSSSRNLPLLPSTRYHLSFFFSSLLVPAALAANPENPAFPLILHSRELGHDDGSPGGLLPVDAGGGAEPRDPRCQGREDRRHCRVSRSTSSLWYFFDGGFEGSGNWFPICSPLLWVAFCSCCVATSYLLIE